MVEKFVYPHLPLINIDIDPMTRYKPPGFPAGTPERNPNKHSDKIKNETIRMQEDITRKAEAKGIDPRLIFKIEYESPIAEKNLNTVGCTLLADLGGEAQVVFADDQKMERFFETLAQYSQGEKPDQKYPSYNNIFANIKNIKPLEPVDCMGPKLRKLEEINDQQYYWLE